MTVIDYSIPVRRISGRLLLLEEIQKFREKQELQRLCLSYPIHSVLYAISLVGVSQAKHFIQTGGLCAEA